MSKKLSYQEGTCFHIPLRTGGFATGIVARLNGKGTIYAYFFGPAIQNINSSVRELEPVNACLIGFCGDLGLIKGSWPIYASPLTWRREKWPLSPLYRHDVQGKKAWLSFYDDRTLSFLREESTLFNEDPPYPYDRLMGYGAVEIRLTKLLGIDVTKAGDINIIPKIE
jgi:hypothetical protein